jgi:hypothetical protein
MSFEFTLRFTGLCAFVPHTLGRRARVLLVGAEAGNGNGAHTPHGHEGHGDPSAHHQHEIHRPAIIFETAYLAPDSPRKPDKVFDSKRLNAQMGVCFLDDQDIEILSVSNTPFSMVRTGSSPPSRCPHRVQRNLRVDSRNDLFWVAPMDVIRQGAGAVAPECLRDTDVPAFVGARVRLDHGTLETEEFAFNNDGLLLWRFLPPTGQGFGHEQALAEVVRLNMEIQDERVSFGGIRFRNPTEPVPKLFLAPRSGRVEAFIKAMPEPDLIEARDPEPVELPGVADPLRRRDRDLHFEEFFRLSAPSNGNGHGLIPFAFGVCSGEPTPPLVRAPDCPPSFFQPSSQA